jgi:hypothetical protein
MDFLKQSNMKKYKHKITGCTVINTNPGTNYIGTGPTLSFNIPALIVESGNDWEEQKEEDSGYYLAPGGTKATRSSDNAIFHIRDIVRGQVSSNTFETGPIMSFVWGDVYCRNNLFAQIGIYKIDLNDLEKVKYITEDGVFIFEEETVVHSVYLSNWLTSSNIVTIYAKSGNRKIFSTKEARLNYIARNKPILSLNDMHEEIHLSALEAHKLIVKVKEKLKADDSNL